MQAILALHRQREKERMVPVQSGSSRYWPILQVLRETINYRHTYTLQVHIIFSAANCKLQTQSDPECTHDTIGVRTTYRDYGGATTTLPQNTTAMIHTRLQLGRSDIHTPSIRKRSLNVSGQKRDIFEECLANFPSGCPLLHGGVNRANIPAHCSFPQTVTVRTRRPSKPQRIKDS